MIVKFLAAALLTVSACLGWWAVSSSAFLWLLPALIALVDAIGLLLRKRWGQILWYAVAATASLIWLIAVVRVAISGWPHESIADSLISLTPGLLLVFVCAVGSIAVTDYFRSKPGAL
jgi:hypothetical protein